MAIAMDWLDATRYTPEIDPKTNCSDRVFAIMDGEYEIMCFCYMKPPKGQLDLLHGCSYVWANCYNDIDGDAHYDKEYRPTHWIPFPPKPKVSS